MSLCCAKLALDKKYDPLDNFIYMTTLSTYPASNLSRFLFSDTRSAVFWLVLRIYLGYEWLMAGWEKFINPVWVGNNSGVAVEGFLRGALQKTSGAHPDVSTWYAYFIENVALDHTVLISYLVTYGEILVGIALIVGFLVGISAFFGVLMNVGFLLAGTVSVNPQWLLMGILLMIAWRESGWFGIDRILLPWLLKKRHTYK
jgi:thiosulfate dehydrogenase [quinone] large subunit